MAADLDRLRQIIENLPVITYTLDLEGPREEGSYVGAGIERLTGYTPDEWLGWRPVARTPPSRGP